jgi:hypothetical protein
MLVLARRQFDQIQFGLLSATSPAKTVNEQLRFIRCALAQ